MSNIIDLAQQLHMFKTFVSAVDAAGLSDTFKSQGPYTILAPTDEAFSKLEPGELEDLLNDPKRLRILLSHHVVKGKVHTDDKSHRNVVTVDGESREMHVEWDGIYVGSARIVEADMDADNGVIQAIDQVILRKAA